MIFKVVLVVSVILLVSVSVRFRWKVLFVVIVGFIIFI